MLAHAKKSCSGTLAFRLFLLVAVMALLVSAGAGEAFGQAAEKWPVMNLKHATPFRGPGGYLSTLKIMLAWGVFLCWVGTTNWVNIDVQALKLDYRLWNPRGGRGDPLSVQGG